MKGLAIPNLNRVRPFAQQSPGRRIGQQSADQWSRLHIAARVRKPSDPPLCGGDGREDRDSIGQQSAAQLPWFQIETSLPSIEEIEAELSRDLGPDDQP